MMKNLFVFFLVITSILQISSAKKCILSNEVRVHVSNDLPSNTVPLKLHCASADDDLGNHTLMINQDFSWRFCDGFFWNTLFFCHFWWGPSQIAIDVYSSHWVAQESDDKYWAARSDGIYFSFFSDPKTFTRRFDWN
ncbi:hypothetical protein ACP275_06G168200 [Erythranthe tilingii]